MPELSQLDPSLEAFRQFLVHQRGASLHTVKNYLHDLSEFCQYLSSSQPEMFGKEGLDVKQVNPLVLRSFLTVLFQKNSPSSIARKLSTLRSFFQYWVKKGHMAQNPARAVHSPKVPKRLPKFLSVDEVTSLIESAVNDDFKGRREKAILELLYSSGLRVSELTGADIGSIDLENRLVKVLGKGGKERLVPIGGEAVGWVRRYQTDGRPALVRNRPAAVRSGSRLFVNARGGSNTRERTRRRRGFSISRRKRPTPKDSRPAPARALAAPTRKEQREIPSAVRKSALNTSRASRSRGSRVRAASGRSRSPSSRRTLATRVATTRSAGRAGKSSTASTRGSAAG